MTQIECLEYTPKNKGALLGFCNIYVPKMGLEMFGIAIFQKQSGEKWIKLPSRKVEKEGEEPSYVPCIRFRERKHQDAFTTLVLEAVALWNQQNKEQVDEGVPF